VLPSLLAGPLVVVFSVAAWWAGQIPRPIEIPVSALLPILMVLPLSAAVGFIPAFVLNGAASVVLIKAGSLFPLLRFPFFWALVGGVLSWSILRLLEVPAEIAFPFIAAGAVCALLCRMRLA
jgi:hypothetical protein